MDKKRLFIFKVSMIIFNVNPLLVTTFVAILGTLADESFAKASKEDIALVSNHSLHFQDSDCFEERLQAFKTGNESGIPIFVPSCHHDGSYVEVQCHSGTGYCWCVNLEGKPIPGTSTKQSLPKCKRKNPRQRNRRGKLKKTSFGVSEKVCTQSERSIFNVEVFDLISFEYKTTNTRVSSVPLNPEHKSELADWKFEQMDTNRNGVLRKREFRTFRRKMKQLSRSKICAQHFWRFCDIDADSSMTKDEWANCLGLHSNVALKLFMSLSSDEGRVYQRNDKLKKKLSFMDDTSDEDEEEAFDSSQGVTLGLSESSDRMKKGDCQTTLRKELETANSGVSNAYLPECDSNGNFSPIQCHKSSGYCWCADISTGEPISSTSVFNTKPDCNKIDKVKPIIESIWKKCPDNKKKEFKENLIDILTKMMVQADRTSTNDDQPEMLLKKKALKWHFDFLDKNSDGKLSRRELRSLVSPLIADPKMKRCGKRLHHHCDQSRDLLVDFNEWKECIEIYEDDENSGTNSRKGPNPLVTWLKSD